MAINGDEIKLTWPFDVAIQWPLVAIPGATVKYKSPTAVAIGQPTCPGRLQVISLIESNASLFTIRRFRFEKMKAKTITVKGF